MNTEAKSAGPEEVSKDMFNSLKEMGFGYAQMHEVSRMLTIHIIDYFNERLDAISDRQKELGEEEDELTNRVNALKRYIAEPKTAEGHV